MLALSVKVSPGFNTWAREEPNSCQIIRKLDLYGFNTWAREEPNV